MALLRKLIFLLAASLTVQIASAQTWPTKPIRLLVGYGAGGATDVAARLLADGWQKILGQQVIVENRPGASGTIAADLVAKAQADGYTVLMGAGGSLTIAVHLMKTGFDPIKDFTPISMFAINDSALVVTPGFPANNMREFIDELKKSPGKYSFGSSGIGGPTHLSGELLNVRAGIRMTHAPYKGDAPAVLDMLGGHLPIMMASIPSVARHIKAGTLKMIAAAGNKRSPEFPNVPTIAESGYPDVFAMLWIAPMVPTGTPAAIVNRLNAATRTVLTDPAVLASMAKIGSRGEASSSEEVARLMQGELVKWGEIIRLAGVKNQ